MNIFADVWKFVDRLKYSATLVSLPHYENFWFENSTLTIESSLFLWRISWVLVRNRETKSIYHHQLFSHNFISIIAEVRRNLRKIYQRAFCVSSFFVGILISFLHHFNAITVGKEEGGEEERHYEWHDDTPTHLLPLKPWTKFMKN